MHSATYSPPSGNRRLLVFVAHFHPHVGGVERYTRELWRRFADRGWTVTVLTSNTNRAPATETVDGLYVIRLPVLQIFYRRLPVLVPGRALLRALQAVARWKPHVVVTNTRFFTTSAVGIAFARGHGIPSLHIDHGSRHVELGSRLGDAASRLIDHTMGTWVARHATRCIGTSSAVVSFLAHLGVRDARVVYNGVDTAAFATAQSNWREDHAIGLDERVVLYVGRLIEDKGVAVLLDAFQRLQVGAPVHLVIAGDGHLLPAVRAAATAEPNIHVLGAVEQRVVVSLLRACDIFVHPSAYPEGLPNSILEAGSAGCAIVATPMGGTEEIIPSPAHGVIVPPRDSAALAAALTRLLNDPGECRRLGEAVRRHVRATFDWELVADGMEQELESLLGSTALR